MACQAMLVCSNVSLICVVSYSYPLGAQVHACTTSGVVQIW